MIEKGKIVEILKGVQYPGYTRDIVSFGMVKEVEVTQDGVLLRLRDFSGKEEIKREIENRIRIALEDTPRVEVTWEVDAERGGKKPTPFVRRHIEGVKKILAVASGKGGVGKSTVTANLCGGFLRLGLKPGIMDADIYGPNIPVLFQTTEKPASPDGLKIFPVEVEGIKIISIGFFLKKEDAVIWRGPLVMKAVQQFIEDTVWENVDVLLVDLPPGTGDAQLTLVQNVYIDGAIIVTTPEKMSVEDARRAHTMFQKVDVHVIGVVENMSYYKCSQCGHEERIFESSEYSEFLNESGLPVLARIPLTVELSRTPGLPLTLVNSESSVSAAFLEACEKIRDHLQL